MASSSPLIPFPCLSQPGRPSWGLEGFVDPWMGPVHGSAKSLCSLVKSVIVFVFVCLFLRVKFGLLYWLCLVLRFNVCFVSTPLPHPFFGPRNVKASWWCCFSSSSPSRALGHRVGCTRINYLGLVWAALPRELGTAQFGEGSHHG